ncbi:hypothetical protein BSLG_008232 [Batrachochytrium salamandrivorans]|nr:hypothetical protein BSLG_008232 [Batrachochytrium salamandrivorans]
MVPLLAVFGALSFAILATGFLMFSKHSGLHRVTEKGHPCSSRILSPEHELARQLAAAAQSTLSVNDLNLPNPTHPHFSNDLLQRTIVDFISQIMHNELFNPTKDLFPALYPPQFSSPPPPQSHLAVCGSSLFAPHMPIHDKEPFIFHIAARASSAAESTAKRTGDYSANRIDSLPHVFESTSAPRFTSTTDSLRQTIASKARTVDSIISSRFPIMQRSSSIFSALPNPAEGSPFSKLFGTSQIESLSSQISEIVTNMRTNRLHERLWVVFLGVVQKHVRLYRHIRRDILQESKLSRGATAKKSTPVSKSETIYSKDQSGSAFTESLLQNDNSNPRHLDDFNAFLGDPTDNASVWSSNMDDLNAKICIQMAGMGFLHSVVGKGALQEKTYLRAKFDSLFSIISKKLDSSGSTATHSDSRTPSRNESPHTGNRFADSVSDHPVQSRPCLGTLEQILMREISVCQVVWPFLERVSHPHIINKAIIDMAQGRIALLKAVKLFRGHLDSFYTQFPPKFLLRDCEGGMGAFHTTLNEKHRIFEAVSKYSRKARSVIDLRAVHHEVIRELKRVVDETRESELDPRLHERVEEYHRYIRALEVLKTKFDKRILALATPSADPAVQRTQKRMKSIPIISMLSKSENIGNGEPKADISLQSILDDYASSPEDGRVTTRTIWRIGLGLGWQDPSMQQSEMDSLEQAQVIPSSAHDRLRKDTLRIFRMYLTSASSMGPTLALPPAIIGSFQRYLSPLLRGELPDTPIEFSERDYQCVEMGQRYIRSELEEIFKTFLHSESYFRWTSERERAKLAQRDRISEPMLTPHAALAASTTTFNPMNLSPQFSALRSVVSSGSTSGFLYGGLSSASFSNATLPTGALPGNSTMACHSGNSSSAFLFGNGAMSSISGKTPAIESFDDAKMRAFNQSALLSALMRELDSAALRLNSTRSPMQAGTGTGTGTGTLARGEGSILRTTAAISQAAAFDLSPSGADIITLDDSGGGDGVDLIEDGVRVNVGRSTTWKGDNDDTDIWPPGELLTNITKLQQIKDDIDKVMLQIDTIDMISWRIQYAGQTSSSEERVGEVGAGSQADAHRALRLDILENTKEMLHVDIGELSRKRTKYESQEQREAIVPGQCSIKIYAVDDDSSDDPTGLQAGSEAGLGSSLAASHTNLASSGNTGTGGHRVIFYMIQVNRIDQKTGWTVRRRYSDFDALHRKLKETFPIVTEFEFPGKHHLGLFLLTSKQEEIKRTARLVALERYLRRLIDNPAVCQSDHVRGFLSSTYQAVRRKGLFRSHVESTKNTSPNYVLPAENLLRRKSRNFAMTLAHLTSKQIKPPIPVGSDATASANYGVGNPAIPHLASTPAASARKSNLSSLFDGSHRRRWGSSDSARATAPAYESAGSKDSDDDTDNDEEEDENIYDEDQGGDTTCLDPIDSTVPVMASVSSPLEYDSSSAYPALNMNVSAKRSGETSDESSTDDIWAGCDLMDLMSDDAGDDPSDSTDPIRSGSFSQPLSDPLCTLLMEAFDFKEQNHGLRRRMASMLLMEAMGGNDAIEFNDRRISLMLMSMFKGESLSLFLESLLMPPNESVLSASSTSTVWPGKIPLYKHLLSGVPPVSMAHQNTARVDAKSKLLTAMPEVFFRILGEDTATQGVTGCFELLQSVTLNKSLMYTLLDALVDTVVNEYG